MAKVIVTCGGIKIDEYEARNKFMAYLTFFNIFRSIKQLITNRNSKWQIK
tara:strand:+ start:805 stop:954 length:150 start_codon:yes stop_codon:yes gene_type:complete